MNEFPLRVPQSKIVAGVARATQGLAAVVCIVGLAVSASARDVTVPQAPSTGAAGSTGRPVHRHHWYEIGVASWYGPQFQGRKTAAGERYDMNSMTCAHPTLPMGTWLKVTNLKNRQTAFVRVNDRGPVFEGRIVDLSLAAAHAVGLKGVGKVKLEAVPPSDPALAEDLMAHIQFPVLFDTLRH